MSQNNIKNTDSREKSAQKKQNEMFNSITQKVKVENQNQTHNAKKEGIAPINRAR